MPHRRSRRASGRPAHRVVLRHVRWSGETGYPDRAAGGQNAAAGECHQLLSAGKHRVLPRAPPSPTARRRRGTTRISRPGPAILASWRPTSTRSSPRWRRRRVGAASRRLGARGGAAKRVEVEIEAVVVKAELNEAGAPRATAALWGALPIEAQLEHTKWLGRACGFRPALAVAGEFEHPVCSIYPGILLARTGRGEVLISYALPNTDRSAGSSTAPGSAGSSATATPCSRF